MKKFIKPAIIIILCVAAIAAGLVYYLTPDTVTVIPAERGSVSPLLSGTGKLEGAQKLTVYSDVSGLINERYVNEGDRVKSGDILVAYAGENQKKEVDLAANDVEYSEKLLDAATGNRASYQKKINDATAKIAECEQVYALLELQILNLTSESYNAGYYVRERSKSMDSDITKLEAQVHEKQSELAKIEADLKEAELDEDNDIDVHKKVKKAKEYQEDIAELNNQIARVQRDRICLPEEEMDPATHDKYLVIQNNLDTVMRIWTDAKTQKDTAQSQLTAYTEIVTDEGQMERNKISLSQAEAELKRAFAGTAAPADGVITGCLVGAGAYVEKGVPIFEMQTDDRYKVRMMVSKYDIASVKKGQVAEIRIGNQEYTGKVSNISQSAQNDATGKAKASIDIDVETDEELIVGLDADVTLELEAAGDVIRIPTEAVYNDDGGSFVYVVENNEIAKKYVTIGLKDSEYTQVEDLEEGTHVVNDPLAAENLGEEVKEEIVKSD